MNPFALRTATRRQQRHAMVLVVVLIAVAMLSLAGYTFARFMFAEREAVWVNGRRLQSRALCDSGQAWISFHLQQPPEDIDEAGGLYDNASLFRGMLVMDGGQARDRARFTVLAPEIRDGLVGGVRYGLEDESTRLNLNTLLLAETQALEGGRTILMALPGMTEDVADAILDWIDTDGDSRQYGAEVDYYSGLDPPYSPKNGPLETVEELLLVRGVTPELLFGPDADRNGSVDAYETAMPSVAGIDNSSGALDHGWSAYLTLYSQEANVQPDGKPKIDLNMSDLEKLHKELSAVIDKDWATFIIAFRQGAKFEGDQPGQLVAGREMDLTQQGGTKLTSVLDLVGVRVQAKFKNEQEAVVIESPFPDGPLRMEAYLPLLLDHTAVNTATAIPGRININQASRVVLAGIPGMTADLVDTIINERDPEVSTDKPGRRHETWLLSEGHVTLEEMKALVPFITAAGRVFRAQIVGYYDQTGPVERMEVVLDATAAPPRLVFWRELSHLGRGYSLETLGIEN